jgi:predicted RNA polymerase sigma factor
VIHRPSISRAKLSQASRKTFRQRYDDLEAQRADLVARLHRLSEASKQHPGYKRALKLLNEIYRREKLPQRFAVLHAASWLITLLEDLTTFL